MSEIISVCDTAAEVLLQDIMEQSHPGSVAVSLAKRAVATPPSAPDAVFADMVDEFEAAQVDPKTSDLLANLLTGQIHKRECLMKDLRSDQNVEKPQSVEKGVNVQRAGAEGPIKYMYHWLFLAFFTIWVKPGRGNAKPAQIILCFDDANGRRVERAINKTLADIACPYSLIGRLAESITLVFDDALWSFRTPIRQIEKVLLPLITKPAQAE